MSKPIDFGFKRFMVRVRVMVRESSLVSALHLQIAHIPSSYSYFLHADPLAYNLGVADGRLIVRLALDVLGLLLWPRIL